MPKYIFFTSIALISLQPEAHKFVCKQETKGDLWSLLRVENIQQAMISGQNQLLALHSPFNRWRHNRAAFIEPKKKKKRSPNDREQ